MGNLNTDRTVSESLFFEKFTTWVLELQLFDYEINHLDKLNTEEFEHIIRYYNNVVKPVWKEMQLGIDHHQRK